MTGRTKPQVVADTRVSEVLKSSLSIIDIQLTPLMLQTLLLLPQIPLSLAKQLNQSSMRRTCILWMVTSVAEELLKDYDSGIYSNGTKIYKVIGCWGG